MQYAEMPLWRGCLSSSPVFGLSVCARDGSAAAALETASAARNLPRVNTPRLACRACQFPTALRPPGPETNQGIREGARGHPGLR